MLLIGGLLCGLTTALLIGGFNLGAGVVTLLLEVAAIEEDRRGIKNGGERACRLVGRHLSHLKVVESLASRTDVNPAHCVWAHRSQFSIVQFTQKSRSG